MFGRLSKLFPEGSSASKRLELLERLEPLEQASLRCWRASIRRSNGKFFSTNSDGSRGFENHSSPKRRYSFLGENRSRKMPRQAIAVWPAVSEALHETNAKFVIVWTNLPNLPTKVLIPS